jgi:hypothetical protein
MQATVYFSEVIDRQSVSSLILRGLCDVWSKINSATFVTDEQNVFSLCPGEVRETWLPFVCTQPHMYPKISAPSNV